MKTYGVPSVEDVRSCITPVLVRKGENPEFQYTDAETGRQFCITQMDSHGYFMCEATPIGRRWDIVNGHMHYSNCDVSMALKDGSANGFRDALREHGISANSQVFNIAGGGLGMIVLDTLEDCAAAIVKSIQDDEWYRDCAPRTEQDRVKDARESAASRHSYWKDVLDTIDRNGGDGTGLFAGTSTGYGAPLSQEARQKILAYLNAPSQDGWLGIRDMLVTRSKTLWLAWCDVDRTAPISGSEGFPDADTLRHALRNAIDATRRRAERELSENPLPSGLRVVK